MCFLLSVLGHVKGLKKCLVPWTPATFFLHRNHDKYSKITNQHLLQDTVYHQLNIYNCTMLYRTAVNYFLLHPYYVFVCYAVWNRPSSGKRKRKNPCNFRVLLYSYDGTWLRPQYLTLATRPWTAGPTQRSVMSDWNYVVCSFLTTVAVQSAHVLGDRKSVV